jgi:hypothetical protein
MTSLQQFQLVGACAVAAVAYLAPTLIALVRLSSDSRRILLLNICLGWTVVGWLYALRLACRRSAPVPAAAEDWTPWRPGRPEAALSLPAPRTTYADGSYLISELGSARTWAICSHGRWGVAYELDGVQRTAAWVDSSDVPLDILAHALASDPELRR